MVQGAKKRGLVLRQHGWSKQQHWWQCSDVLYVW